jgi:thiol-disulfide isomerase/thioredoxin
VRPRLAILVILAGAALPPPAAAGAELDQFGRSHRWEGATGQLTLIEFAASWCAPCRRTLPRLEEFARTHPQVRVLVVSVDERREGRDALVDALRLSLPVIWDEEHRIAERFQPEAMPAAVLVSPAGEVLSTARGSRHDDWDRLVRQIEAAAP